MKRPLRTGVMAAVVVFGTHPALAADSTAACVQAANDGQKLQQTGKFLESRALFSRCSQPDCPAEIQTDCGEWSMRLSARMPSLALGVVDAHGTEAVGAELTLDGKPVTTAAGLAIEMDPGVHEITARTRTGATGTLRFVAHEGERSRKLVIQLGASPAERQPPTTRTLPVAQVGLGVSGLALAGLGIGFAVSGTTSYSHLQDTCSPLCSDDAVSSARTRSIVGDVLLTTGVVTLAVAVVWYVLAPRRPPTLVARF